MRVSVIGCTHAGTAAVLNLKKLDPSVEVTVYERNSTISFLSCGIALYVAGVVQDPLGLFYSSPEKLAELGVAVKMNHEVVDVDLTAQKIMSRKIGDSNIEEDYYDKLVVTTGSWPRIPDIPGIELENILLAKNYDHANQIIEKAKNADRITVVGAGYIGVELVEAFRVQGKSVSLIESADRILNRYLDQYFTEIAEETLVKNGIHLLLGESIIGFDGRDGRVTKVVTDRGEYETDLVILCTGFEPNTSLFRGKLEMLSNGAIIIDEYLRTSHQDVFAAGDCCAVRFNPTGTFEYIPLATNAVRMGTLVAQNIIKPAIKYSGTQGTSGIKVYEYNIASTGLTEETARSAGLDVSSSLVVENHRPEFMPEYEAVHIKVVFEKDSRRIVGAQILSKADLTQSINTLSVCIQNKMTINELAFIDFFFQPNYNKPWNFLNSVALKVI